MDSVQLLQRLVDESDIRQVVDGISNAVDDKDWQTCRAYFTDDIEVDFTSLTGGEPLHMKADDLVYGGWSRNLFQDKISHHMHTSHRITLDGDHATCFSKGVAWNKLTRVVGDPLWEVWGNYTYRLIRTSSGWKCEAMKFQATHGRGNEKVREFSPE
jgi:ketosteroid isomerase-like protein